jgi:hypothetical protein
MSQRRRPTYTDYGSDAPAQRLRADGKIPLVVGDAMFWNNRQAIVDLIKASRHCTPMATMVTFDFFPAAERHSWKALSEGLYRQAVTAAM